MTGTVISEHKDRVVFEDGDRFVKEFATTRARDAEVERLSWLEKAGVKGPEILGTVGSQLVTARPPGEPLDEIVRTRWAAMGRAEKTALVRRVAAVCGRIRDAGFAWPDLVTYHLYVAPKEIRVLDPARLRKGRLDLSPLYWSAAEPTVSRTDPPLAWLMCGLWRASWLSVATISLM